MSKFKKFIPWLIAGAIVLLAIGIPFIASARNARASEPVDSASVTTVSVTDTIEASGAIEAQPYADLAWKTSGTVETVHVRVGDVVQAGEILMSLQAVSAPANIIAAQSDLVKAQENLEDIKYSRLQTAQSLDALDEAQRRLDELNIAAAEESSNAQYRLEQARETYDDAVRDRQKMDYAHSTDELTIEKARVDFLLAEDDYLSALKEYNKVSSKNPTNLKRVMALNRLVTARDRMDHAFDTYNWYIQDYSAEDIAQADADVAVAKAALDSALAEWERLKDGASEATIQLAEAGLEDAQTAWEEVKEGPNESDLVAAQAAVDAAQATVNSLYIISPFGGEVLAVEQHPGDVVSTGSQAITLADRSNLFIDALVDEADIAWITLGDPAVVTSDALPGVTLKGEVTLINPVGETISGLVKFPVRIQLQPLDQAIPLGATADVTILVSEVRSALAVPISAIQNDADGEFVQLVSADGSSQRLAVVSGDLVGDLVVVMGDLAAGDLVSTDNQNASGFQAPNPFGGE
jgi:RND family efflux transporter MFP subunit